MEQNDDELEDEPLEGEELPEQQTIKVQLHPAQVDTLFENIHNTINMIHSMVAHLYDSVQEKVMGAEVLRVELDTTKKELQKYKDELLQIYSAKATEPGKRENKDEL